MPTVLTDLVFRLDMETGAGLAEADLVELLIAGAHAFNAYVPQGFELSGTTLDRDATPSEQGLLVGFATLVWLNREISSSSLSAIVHSNVAGRTDLTEVHKALRARRKELWDQTLKPLIEQLESSGAGSVANEVFVRELGETLPWARRGDRGYPLDWGPFV